jgi:hypothetical protein
MKQFRQRLRALEERLGIKTGLPMLDIIMVPIAPLFDAEGNSVYGGQRCDSVRARVEYGPDTTYYDRDPGETLEAFKARILATHPRGRFPRVVGFIPPDPPSA